MAAAFSASLLVVKPKLLLVTPHQSLLLHVTMRHPCTCSTGELNLCYITFSHSFTQVGRASSSSSEEHVAVQSHQLREAVQNFLLSIRCSRPGLWQNLGYGISHSVSVSCCNLLPNSYLSLSLSQFFYIRCVVLHTGSVNEHGDTPV